MGAEVLANSFLFRGEGELFLTPRPLQTSECRQIYPRHQPSQWLPCLFLGSLRCLFREEKNSLLLRWGWVAKCLAAGCVALRMGGVCVTGGHFVP